MINFLPPLGLPKICGALAKEIISSYRSQNDDRILPNFKNYLKEILFLPFPNPRGPGSKGGEAGGISWEKSFFTRLALIPQRPAGNNGYDRFLYGSPRLIPWKNYRFLPPRNEPLPPGHLQMKEDE